MFELSMLAEVVAVESGLELGEVTYFAGSMHLYDRHIEKAKAWTPPTNIVGMPRIPAGTSPLAELNKLCKFEAELRHGSAAVDDRSIGEWLDRITGEFSPYWAQFGFLLLGAIATTRSQRMLDATRSRIGSSLLPFVPLQATVDRKQVALLDAGPLFGAMQSETNVVVFGRPELRKKFAELADKHEKLHGKIGAVQLLRAQEQILDRLAARGESGALTEEAFRAAILAAE